MGIPADARARTSIGGRLLSPARMVPVLFFLSGFCALVYQVIWTRWLGLVLGNFGTAAATVVATFMLGLAIGSAVFGRAVAARPPRRGLLVYAALEAALTFLAALSPLVGEIHHLYAGLAASWSPVWARAALCGVFLLPPTILMGGTLPALVHSLSAVAPRALGPLYAHNTFGAALGPMLSAFVLMPTLGLKATLWLCCAVNAVVAAAALAVAQRMSAAEPSPAAVPVPLREPAPGPGRAGFPSWLPYALAAASGFIALAFEIALTRLTILTVVESSVYGYAMVLSSYLTGIALGAWLLRRRAPGTARGAFRTFAAAQAAIWLFSLSLPFWDLLPQLAVELWTAPVPQPVQYAAAFAVVLALLLVLTTASGLALPALARALEKPAAEAIGRLFAANTAGATLGALAAGFVLLPRLGLNSALLTLGAGALLAAAAAAAFAGPRPRPGFVLLAVPLAAAGFALPPPDARLINAGMHMRPEIHKQARESGGSRAVERIHASRGNVIYSKDGWSGSVAVFRTSAGRMCFTINGKPDGSTSSSDMPLQILSAHLPVLAHGDPKALLLVGLGTGVTAGSLALHERVRKIDVVEIDPAIASVARLFSNHNYRVMENRKVRVHFDDARHFLATRRGTYDVIISEPSNLFVSGMCNLFTREYYRIARARLADDGIFMQWIQCYRIDPETLRGLVRTVRDTFPHATFWAHREGDSLVLAGKKPWAVDVTRWVDALESPRIALDLRRIAITDPWLVFDAFLWGPKDIERHTAGRRICTDDLPYPEFTSPLQGRAGESVRRIMADLRSASRLEPMPLAEDLPEIRNRLGSLFAVAGRFNRAGAEFRQALRLDPGSAQARYGLATCYLAAGKLRHARAEVEQALRIEPGRPDALRLLSHMEEADEDEEEGEDPDPFSPAGDGEDETNGT